MNATFFPRGDTHISMINIGRRCLWRELLFILHLVCQASNPKIDLKSYIDKWNEISVDLQDTQRKRKKQIYAFSLS